MSPLIQSRTLGQLKYLLPTDNPTRPLIAPEVDGVLLETHLRPDSLSMRALTSFILDRFSLDGYEGLDELLLLNELSVPISAAPLVVRRDFRMAVNPIAIAERTIQGRNAFSTKFVRASQDERASLIEFTFNQYLRLQPAYMTEMQLAYHKFARISDVESPLETMDTIVYLGVPFPLSLLITPLTLATQRSEMASDVLRRALAYLDRAKVFAD